MTDSAEFDAIRKKHHYRCCICRQPEKVTGTLMPVSGKTAGADCTLPVCPEHYVKYLQGFFTGIELKKIGISSEEYQQALLKKTEEPDSGSGLSAEEKVIRTTEETIKKIQKAQKMKMPKVHSDYKKEI
ncbi:MAG: hypothetical protein WC626_12790 [Methanoregula sp.]